MTLTEQWKKGELEVGEEYWVILTDEWYLRSPVVPVRAFYSCECKFEGYLDNDIKEVLAPVPSYEELEELKIDNHNLKAWIKNFQPKYKEMEKENTQLHKFLEEFNALDVAKENKKLKDLLKEIRGKLKYINTPKNQHNIFGNVMMAKIDEVLK